VDGQLGASYGKAAMELLEAHVVRAQRVARQRAQRLHLRLRGQPERRAEVAEERPSLAFRRGVERLSHSCDSLGSADEPSEAGRC
jgi:hypothetical protein